MSSLIETNEFTERKDGGNKADKSSSEESEDQDDEPLVKHRKLPEKQFSSKYEGESDNDNAPSSLEKVSIKRNASKFNSR